MTVWFGLNGERLNELSYPSIVFTCVLAEICL